MNRNLLSRRLALALALAVGLSAFAAYNVRRPSDAIRPRWQGAKVGEWTMDYAAATSLARAEGRINIVFVTGSWWCPHCEAFEEKVLLSDTWKKLLAERDFYLTMLDFPYRGHVKDEELHKSRYPEKGDGWGFQCWLYDDEYLAENGLTAEDGFREIQKRYEVQKSLALETASLVTIRTWDDSADFTYGKVGYPSLIIYLPDGSEAGRFVPFVTYMEADEAQQYVVSQIKTIIADALNAQCGLCSDPDADECGLSGKSSRRYFGWLTGTESGIVSTIEVRSGRANRKGELKLRATVTLGGKKIQLAGVTTNGCEVVSLSKRNVSATLKLGIRGLSGTLDDGEARYVVTGAHDAFSASKDDTEGRMRAAALQSGNWSLVMRPEASDHAFAGGFGTLTVAVKAKGKATVSGKLGDGTRVNVSGRLIAGEDGIFCLPVNVTPYCGKAGGFSCNLWFKNGWLINVTDVSEWKSAKGEGFSVNWTPFYTALPGISAIAEDMELLFNEPLSELNGVPLAEDPEADSITATRTRWKGTVTSGFAARLATRTGTFSGSMNFYTDRGGGSVKRTRATIYGVVVGGTGYGTVLVNNIGSWAVKISACAACED